MHKYLGASINSRLARSSGIDVGCAKCRRLPFLARRVCRLGIPVPAAGPDFSRLFKLSHVKILTTSKPFQMVFLVTHFIHSTPTYSNCNLQDHSKTTSIDSNLWLVNLEDARLALSVCNVPFAHSSRGLFLMWRGIQLAPDPTCAASLPSV